MESATRGETSGEKFGQKHAVRGGTAVKEGRRAGAVLSCLVTVPAQGRLACHRGLWYEFPPPGKNPFALQITKSFYGAEHYSRGH
jgi:hypothetical protein